MAVLRPDLMMKCVIPVVMAGIIAIVRHFLAFMEQRLTMQYGLVVSVLISGDRMCSCLDRGLKADKQSHLLCHCTLVSSNSVLVFPSVLLVSPPVSLSVSSVMQVSGVLPSSQGFSSVW